MTNVRKCDHCESTYAMERAEPPYPVTLADDWGGQPLDLCSAKCLVDWALAMEVDGAYRTGVADGKALRPERKRRWF